MALTYPIKKDFIDYDPLDPLNPDAIPVAENLNNLAKNQEELKDDTNRIGRIQSEFGLNGATLTDITETDGEIELDAVQTTGTAEKVISVQTLGYRNIKLDVANLSANNNLYYKLEDSIVGVIQANTEIITNGTHIIDLSFINTTTYPNDLILTYQFDRDSTSDDSPTISNHSVTWEGAGGRVLYDEGVTTIDSSIVSIPVPDNKKIEIELLDISATTSSVLYFRFNSDSGTNYSFGYWYNTLNSGSASASAIQIGTAGQFNDGNLFLELFQPSTDKSKLIRGIGTNTTTGGTWGIQGSWQDVTNKITTLDILFDTGNVSAGLKYKVYYYV